MIERSATQQCSKARAGVTVRATAIEASSASI